MSLARVLPMINAVLVTMSGVLIVRGVRLIRRGDQDGHKRSMLSATALASIFLVLYLYRIYNFGLIPFPGPQWAKNIYLFVLFSHILLAVISTPFVLAALGLGLKGDFVRHVKVARLAYPMWLYVAATGPLVYLMLHHWC